MEHPPQPREPGFREHLDVTYKALELTDLIARVSDARSGAIASFLGTVRSPNKGNVVTAISYEGYESMIGAELERIATQLRNRYPLQGLAMVHRLGRCLAGEASIAIVACTPHREASFDACRDALNLCKARLPVWKHEEDDEGAHWVAGQVVATATL